MGKLNSLGGKTEEHTIHFCFCFFFFLFFDQQKIDNSWNNIQLEGKKKTDKKKKKEVN